MTAATSDRSPVRVGLLLPCHNEAHYLSAVLGSLLPQIDSHRSWCIVAVDDSSSDDTGTILDEAAADAPGLTVIHGTFGSPGAARSAAAASLTVLGPEPMPEWLVTIDCDLDIPTDFVSGWQTRFDEIGDDHDVGALNGLEAQDHLFDGLPNAAAASSAFGRAVVRSEAAVGVSNLGGVNHAIRTPAYLTAGPYVQPELLGPDGVVRLAGEDWDLGVRVRLAGYRIEECPVTVIDRGRRLLADVHAYVTGEAYEGAFERVGGDHPPVDIDASIVTEVANATIDRVLVHFFFKIILADPSLLEPGTDIGLQPDTMAEMAEWIRRWPFPTFAESRNGFVYGRLPRFAGSFNNEVRRQLDLVDALG